MKSVEIGTGINTEQKGVKVASNEVGEIDNPKIQSKNYFRERK